MQSPESHLIHAAVATARYDFKARFKNDVQRNSF
jgi:hypothetical protein